MPEKAIKNTFECENTGSIPAFSTNEVQKLAPKRAFSVSEQKTVAKNVASFRKRFMAKTPYKTPSIIRSKNGDWHVEYRFELPDQSGKFKRFKVRDGINYIRNIEHKEKAIKQLRNDVEKELVKGYNPFIKPESIKNQAHEAIKNLENAEKQRLIDEVNKKWTLKIAIERFNTYCKWKELSSNTTRTYESFLNNFEEWLNGRNELDIPAYSYLETDLIKFLDTYYDQEDWTPRTYNNHIAFFITFFNRISKLEKKGDRNIRYEIDLTEPEYKTDTAEKNRYYTPIVADLVKKELDRPEYKNLKQFIKWIFLSCMRPREIRLLKVQHINLEARQIKAIGPTAKTGDRYVPISDELLELIKEFKIEELAPNDHLFWKHNKTPSDMFPKDYFSSMYLEIKKKLNLDKNYTMYGWKHTRVVELIYSGFSDEAIKELTGHRDDKSFQAYKRDLIPNQNSLMKGKTISF